MIFRIRGLYCDQIGVISNSSATPKPHKKLLRCGAKKRTVNSNSHRFFVYSPIFNFNIILESPVNFVLFKHFLIVAYFQRSDILRWRDLLVQHFHQSNLEDLHSFLRFWECLFPHIF